MRRNEKVKPKKLDKCIAIYYTKNSEVSERLKSPKKESENENGNL